MIKAAADDAEVQHKSSHSESVLMNNTNQANKAKKPGLAKLKLLPKIVDLFSK